MSVPVLNQAEYEAAALLALLDMELAPEFALDLLAHRYPMTAADVLSECRARGWHLTADDQLAYLHARFDRYYPPQAMPLTPGSIEWPAGLVNGLLEWAQAVGRGEPVATEAERTRLTRPSSVAESLALLRSEDLTQRMVAGSLLAESLAVGMAVFGQTVDPATEAQVATWISEAMSGSSAAVDLLEKAVTTEPPAHRRERKRRAALN